MVRLTDHPDMTLDVYRGCKTTTHQQQQQLQTELKMYGYSSMLHFLLFIFFYLFFFFLPLLNEDLPNKGSSLKGRLCSS